MQDQPPQELTSDSLRTPETPNPSPAPETTPAPTDPTISPFTSHREPKDLITTDNRPEYTRLLAERGYQPATLNNLADSIDDTSPAKRRETTLAHCPKCQAAGGHVWAFHHPEHEFIHWALICLACGTVSG